MQCQDESAQARSTAFIDQGKAGEVGKDEEPGNSGHAIRSDKMFGANRSNSVEKSIIFIPFLHENPYQTILANKLEDQGVRVTGGYSLRRIPLWGAGSPHAIHLHWLPKFSRSPLGLLKLIYFCIRLSMFRILGKSVVWTVHNLHSHEVHSPVLEKLVVLGVYGAASSVIVHSPIARTLLLSAVFAKSSRKVTCIPHGNYLESYPNEIPRAVARERFSFLENETVFLFIGYIRPYKGINQLIDSFKKIDRDDVKLLIVGRAPNEHCLSDLHSRVAQDTRISVVPGFVSDSELQVYFNASDVVVYPYKNVLTSGAVILGMSFAKPCIAPKIGCIPDYLDSRGAFLYDSESDDGLGEALRCVCRNGDKLLGMGQYNLKKSRQWDWSGIAAHTAALY